MAKASLTLANGTSVEIEGTVTEIRALLEFYGGANGLRQPTGPSRAMPKTMDEVKQLGDTAAHDRTYITQQVDIDDVKAR